MSIPTILPLLQRFQIAWNAANPKVTEEDPSITYGNAGEELFETSIREFCSSNKIENYKLFRSIRLHSNTSEISNTREIDYILIIPSCIYIIEIKNWSGVLKLCTTPSTYYDRIYTKECWAQERKTINQIIYHRSAVLYAISCCEFFLNTLNTSYKYDIYKQINNCNIKTYVIFVNDNIIFDQSIRNNLSEFQHITLLSTFLNKLKQEYANNCTFSPSYDNLIKICKLLPTWDTLYLHGGRTFKGKLNKIPNIGEKLLNKIRKNYESLIFTHSRSRIVNFTKILLGYDCNINVIKIHRDDQQKPKFWMDWLLLLFKNTISSNNDENNKKIENKNEKDSKEEKEKDQDTANKWWWNFWSNYNSQPEIKDGSEKELYLYPHMKIEFRCVGDNEAKLFEINDIIQLDLSAKSFGSINGKKYYKNSKSKPKPKPKPKSPNKRHNQSRKKK